MDIRTVRFRQAGGFAGLVRGTEIDGGDLTGAERRALVRAVSASPVEPGGAARDTFVYELELETDQGTRRLTLDEAGASGALEALLQRLSNRARPIPLR